MTIKRAGLTLLAVAMATALGGGMTATAHAQPTISAVVGGAAALPVERSKADPQANDAGSGAGERGGHRLCRLSKPLFGGSTARVTCYATAAFAPRGRVTGDESAMLGDPTMDHDDEILEELDVPDGVRDASEAVEVMRAWVADGALHVIFDPETFRHDVSEWGRLLGDVAQHISNAVELDGQMSRHEALARIHEAIDMSVNANAVTMEGKIKGRTEH